MKRATALAAFLLLAWARPAAPESFAVARDGRPLCAIDLPAGAGERRVALARELQHWMTAVVGTSIPLAAEAPVPARILLGTVKEFPGEAVPKDLEPLGPEGFLLRSRKSRLWILAETELGLRHGVYAFLEHLGCRWYFPDPVWTVVPNRPTLNVEIDRTERPAFDYRRIWYCWGANSDALRRDYDAWMTRNRQHGHFQIECSHAWERFLPPQEFDAHPEWFALVDGKRQATQLCPSNPEVQQRVVDGVLAAFRKDPDLNMVSVEPNDGAGYCECERCRALGSVSDGVFHIANVAARALRREFPDKWVGLYAYAGHSAPPSIRIEPGVYVQVTTGFRYTDLTFEEQVAALRDRGATLGVYDYFSVYIWDLDQPGAARAGRVDELADAVRHYRDLGLTTYDCESSCNWGPNGPGYWIASKMLWDPDLDAGALVDDFCRTAFGRAAEPMRRLYDRWFSGERFTRRGLKLALLDLEAAYAAEDAPAVRARLDRIAMYLHALRLWLEYDRTVLAAPPDRMGTEATSEALRRAREVIVFSRRLMDTGLIHAYAMLLTSRFGERFRALERIDGLPPLMVEAWKTERTDVPTSAETARHFAADLESVRDLAAAEIGRATFPPPRAAAARLLPDAVAAWGDVPRSPLAVESGLHVFAAGEGEALDLSFTPFDDNHTIDGHWTLRRFGETAIASEGDVRADRGQPARIETGTLAGGLYSLDPGTDYWKAAQVEFTTRPLSVWAGRPGRNEQPKRPQLRFWLPRLDEPLYFFVPKGTRAFVVGLPDTGLNLSALEIRAPGGRTVCSESALVSGEEVSVMVPPGTDGAIWSLALSSLRCVVELHGVPPWLARHPAELLVPGDAAPPAGQ